ncbi:MAG: EthD family reductase [Natronomonas sp.]
MLKVVVGLVRKQGLDYEAFRDYWLTEHVPLAEAIPGLERYATSLPRDPEERRYDGFAQLYFEDEATLERALSSEAVERTGADLENFADTEAGFQTVVEETVHVP